MKPTKKYQLHKHGTWKDIKYSWFIECLHRKHRVRVKLPGEEWVEYKGTSVEEPPRLKYYYLSDGHWAECSESKYYVDKRKNKPVCKSNSLKNSEAPTK